jgi:predicted porin
MVSLFRADVLKPNQENLMKKTLVALAVLAASGAAMAQSSVTLYGIADVYVGKTKGSSVAMGSGGVSTSRLGFKGSEDLGGGLTAIFTFEQAIDLTNGSTRFDPPTLATTTGVSRTFDRQANVGFTGGFGTVKLGRNWNAMDDVFGVANSGFDSVLSANRAWLNTYNGAADAQLYYATPEFAGFTAAVSTQLKGNAAGGKLSAFNVAYANGPVAVALGYEKDEANGDQKGTLLNGSYDLGMAKLLASYYTTDNTGGVAGAEVNSYQIGADVPLSSALVLSVGYASSKPKDGQSDSGFGVAASYSLSKRTSIYGGVRAESRKSANGKADGDFYALGVRHAF